MGSVYDKNISEGNPLPLDGGGRGWGWLKEKHKFKAEDRTCNTILTW
jgi:hypothetical protein